MLRPRTFVLILPVLFLVSFALVSPQKGESSSTLRRLTNTLDQSMSLHPSLSNDGLNVVFESTADLAGVGGSSSFRALRANLAAETATFQEIGRTRVISAGLSRDGSKLAFASNEDLLGQNADRNSEIYFFDGVTLKQITHTSAAGDVARISEGNFQPSLSNDGQFLAFSSNRNLAGQNADSNLELFLYNTVAQSVIQLTTTINDFGASDAKISGDGFRIAFIGRAAEADGEPDLKLHDRTTGHTEVIAANVPGLSLTNGRAISDDGARVVYCGDYLSDGSSNQSQVFLFDARENAVRQITTLGVRATDVDLQATISGDGKRVAFATRRKVVNASDGGVELYLFDIPSAQVTQITDAPSSATAEVVSSLNYDGSLVAFSFPRVLSGPVASSDSANNPEIYLATIAPRPAFGAATVLNGAAKGNEPAAIKSIAPGSIVSIRGDSLASKSEQAKLSTDGTLPFSVAGTDAFVNGQQARILYVSPGEVSLVIPSSISSGPAEIVVTNADGFQSKATTIVSPTAPGVFTTGGEGRGEGVILNADTLVAGPFDPTDGHLRWSIFATGVRNASHVVVNIAGRAINADTIARSQSLPGLDEIHVVVPADLRGAGIATLFVAADSVESNTVTVEIGGSSLRDIMINEFLADPPDGLVGDANHDGVRDSAADEFVELVNSTARDLDVSGYQLQSRSATTATDITRHRFAGGTILPAGTAFVVFGGGSPDLFSPVFGGSQIVKASSGGLSLTNSGGVITLRDASGAPVSAATYGAAVGLQGDANQSLTRSPDITGNFLLHKLDVGSGGNAFSPGTRLDGTVFLPTPTPLPTPSPSPSPSVTPAPSPSPTPTATPTPSPGPSPSPSPTISPTPLPSPSPSPTPTPPVNRTAVISEFRTRGPNGASDEFVEIYNNGDSALDVSGWKLRGSSSNGSVTTRLTINAGTQIPSRGHFLVINSGGYSGSVPGDQMYTSGIANDGGVALTLPDDSIVDQVGLSAGSAYREGMHLAPLPSDANQSYERKPGGVDGSTQDTSDNVIDFQLLTPSDPQNRNSSPTPGPSPVPSPSPSPSPTATPTPSPTSSPSPSPTPTVSPTPLPSPSPSPTPRIVISQIFGGGGNSGAPYRNDFIEIFNSGQTVVNLAGWSVQYASATATSWSVTSLHPVLLAPGQYYLVQESSGGNNGAPLPIPDVTGTIAMASTAGKVALVRSTVALAGVCPSDVGIVDQVGYGSSASCFRGAGPTPSPGNATAVLRGSNGCTDTQNNSSDFAAVVPNPRNSLSTTSPCFAPTTSSILTAEYKQLWREPWWLFVYLLPKIRNP